MEDAPNPAKPQPNPALLRAAPPVAPSAATTPPPLSTPTLPPPASLPAPSPTSRPTPLQPSAPAALRDSTPAPPPPLRPAPPSSSTPAPPQPVRSTGPCESTTAPPSAARPEPSHVGNSASPLAAVSAPAPNTPTHSSTPVPSQAARPAPPRTSHTPATYQPQTLPLSTTSPLLQSLAPRRSQRPTTTAGPSQSTTVPHLPPTPTLTQPQPPPTLLGPSFDWQYSFRARNLRDLDVIDDEFVESAKQSRLRRSASYAARAMRRKLNGKEASTVNLLKSMWTRDVFFRLVDDFQLKDSGLESKLTFSTWASFLAVVLKGCFFNCASFSEMYSFQEEYGDTNELMAELKFMAMKRELSCSRTSGYDQRVVSSDYDLEAVEDRTKDLETGDLLVTKFTILFVPRTADFMIDDDSFETQADSGAMATQKNPKKGRSGPLVDAMRLADIRFITAFTNMRREIDELLASVRRLIGRLDTEGKKPCTIFFMMSVIGALHADGVSVFGIARDFEPHTKQARSIHHNGQQRQAHCAIQASTKRRLEEQSITVS